MPSSTERESADGEAGAAPTWAPRPVVVEPDAPETDAEVRELTDPKSLRALTHPVRLALLDALAVHPTLTATQAGAVVNASPTTCSFHFRQLSKYGFVEQAGRGPGRERPWRLTNVAMRIPTGDGQRVAESIRTVTMLMLERHLDQLRQWIENRDKWPAEWVSVTDQSQFLLWVTPDELAEVVLAYCDVIGRYRGRINDPASRPDGARPVEVLTFAFPTGSPPAEREH